MAVAKRRIPTDPEAFLAWENRQKLRYELLAGEAFLLAGGSLAHDLIATNIVRLLGNALEGSPCRVHGSNLKIRSPADAIMYPDAFVRCGPAEDEATVVDDPVIVVEVFSLRRSRYDMGIKRHALRAIPSLRHLIFVHQDQVLVEHESRDGEDRWLCRLHRRLEEVVEIDEPPVKLPLRALYAGTGLAG